MDSSRDEKLKHRSRRRSRSKSLDGKHHRREKSDRSRDKKSRHRDRRLSRSVSPEAGHQRVTRLSPTSSDENKSKRRRRSLSPEDKPHDPVTDIDNGCIAENSKHHGRQRSRSSSGENGESNLSPSTEENELKHGEQSILEPVGGK